MTSLMQSTFFLSSRLEECVNGTKGNAKRLANFARSLTI
ncbi:hypothetical protein BN129_2462 [Cronobacter sakazakii 701]|nr:hypothetical protein BN129_2462 [Cronobacter sakazakii 701]